MDLTENTNNDSDRSALVDAPDLEVTFRGWSAEGAASQSYDQAKGSKWPHNEYMNPPKRKVFGYSSCRPRVGRTCDLFEVDAKLYSRSGVLEAEEQNLRDGDLAIFIIEDA